MTSIPWYTAVSPTRLIWETGGLSELGKCLKGRVSIPPMTAGFDGLAAGVMASYRQGLSLPQIPIKHRQFINWVHRSLSLTNKSTAWCMKNKPHNTTLVKSHKTLGFVISLNPCLFHYVYLWYYVWHLKRTRSVNWYVVMNICSRPFCKYCKLIFHMYPYAILMFCFMFGVVVVAYNGVFADAL